MEDGSILEHSKVRSDIEAASLHPLSQMYCIWPAVLESILNFQQSSVAP